MEFSEWSVELLCRIISLVGLFDWSVGFSIFHNMIFIGPFVLLDNLFYRAFEEILDFFIINRNFKISEL